jgi:hypothetical protein
LADNVKQAIKAAIGWFDRSIPTQLDFHPEGVCLRNSYREIKLAIRPGSGLVLASCWGAPACLAQNSVYPLQFFDWLIK